VFGLPVSGSVVSRSEPYGLSNFFSKGLSMLGSSPPWVCGLPVVTNFGVGDEARVIEQYNFGVLVEGGSADSVKFAL